MSSRDVNMMPVSEPATLLWDAIDGDAPAPGPLAMPRRRVLVGAYAASPDRGSEPGLGWNITRALAAYHDVTLLCSPGMPGPEHSAFKDEIETWLRANGPVPGLTIRYVDRPRWSDLCQREREIYRFTLYYSGYAAWQRAAYRTAARMHMDWPFEAAHHLNIMGFREPGYLWKLPVPFFWGPVAGAPNIPASFFPLMGRRDQLSYGLRNVINEWQKRTRLRCRKAAARASRIWVVGEENRRMVRELWSQDKAHPLLETGAGVRPGAVAKTRDRDGSLRVVWSGVHIGRKCLPVLLHALAKLQSSGNAPRVEVTILGSGLQTESWRALAKSLGIESLLRWTGRVPLEQALAEMAKADVLVTTSVQEATSLVVSEAISFGLPVVCHDACGMAVAITDACGIKVPLVDPRTSTDGFAAALRRLTEEQGLLEKLSAGALRRAAELTWDSIGRTIATGYHEVLSGAATNATAGRTGGAAA